MTEWLTSLSQTTVCVVAFVSAFSAGLLGLIAAISNGRKSAVRFGCVAAMTAVAVTGDVCLTVREIRNNDVHGMTTDCIHEGVAQLLSNVVSYAPTSPVNQKIGDATELLMKERNYWSRLYCELRDGLLMLFASRQNGPIDAFVFIPTCDLATICKDTEFFHADALARYLFASNAFWPDGFHSETEVFNAFAQALADSFGVGCVDYTGFSMPDDRSEIVYSFGTAGKECSIDQKCQDWLRSMSRFDLQRYALKILKEAHMDSLERFVTNE